MNLIRIGAVIAVSMCLTACPTTSVKPPENRSTVATIRAPDVRGASVFTVDSKASEVNVHVFRGGTLSRLGHNHMLTSEHLTGRVWIHPSFERSGFELQFPVAQLVVDDPKARAAAGGEFPGTIPDDDRNGTRTNMLRAEVLDAEQHPTIKLQSARVSGSAQVAQITTRITIKGVPRDVTVPAALTVEGERLTARGEFDVLQTEFGIKPFTIGLGALAVQDRLHIVFRIVATRGE